MYYTYACKQCDAGTDVAGTPKEKRQGSLAVAGECYQFHTVLVRIVSQDSETGTGQTGSGRLFSMSK